MTRTMLDFLRRLSDPASEERRLYRERRVAGACPLCGCADPGNAFCADCYSAMQTARADARARGPLLVVLLRADRAGRDSQLSRSPDAVRSLPRASSLLFFQHQADGPPRRDRPASFDGN